MYNNIITVLSSVVQSLNDLKGHQYSLFFWAKIMDLLGPIIINLTNLAQYVEI